MCLARNNVKQESFFNPALLYKFTSKSPNGLFNTLTCKWVRGINRLRGACTNRFDVDMVILFGRFSVERDTRKFSVAFLVFNYYTHGVVDEN